MTQNGKLMTISRLIQLFLILTKNVKEKNGRMMTLINAYGPL